MGGYIGPPLKTRVWEDPGHPDYPLAESRKKVRSPPADGPAGGNSPLFFENRRQHGRAARDLTEKLVKTGYPLFEPFLAQVAQNGGFLGVPIGVQGIEEKCNLPIGGELRGHLEVYLGPGDAVRP